MAAPKKPNYAALRKQVPEIMWAVKGRQELWLGLLDRAEWLENQRSEKPEVSLPPIPGGKVFKGMDPKGGRHGG